jgi:hypothetical protein
MHWILCRIPIALSIQQPAFPTHQFANVISRSTRRSAPGIEIWCRQNYSLLLHSRTGNIYRYHRDASCFFVGTACISSSYWDMEVIRIRTSERVALGLFAGELLYNHVSGVDMPLIEIDTTRIIFFFTLIHLQQI